MKKVIVFLLLVCVCAGVFAQTVYVSAKGNEDNSGLKETEPTTFDMAIAKASFGQAKKIIVIGTLDVNSNGVKKRRDSVFTIIDYRKIYGASDTPLGEITITGKPGAKGAERAVLSAKGSGTGCVLIYDIGDNPLKIRFENIEISGTEGENKGLDITGGQVTLGPGAVVCNNAFVGIVVEEGTCVMDGGEVSNNSTGVVVGGVVTLRNGSIRNNSSSGSGAGIFVSEGGQFTMTGGSITGNKTGTSGGYVGGGVVVGKDGRFTMSGGSITGNRAQGSGGGVYVQSGGRFDQNGGTVSGNTSGNGSNPDILRE